MRIRVNVGPDGETEVEAICLLEDLWCDYQFFKAKGDEAARASTKATDALLVKRYHRAALLLLVAYFESVIDHWLLGMLSKNKLDKLSLEKKIAAIQLRLTTTCTGPEINPAKQLRNKLVHLKPGVDGELYDEITGSLLEQAEESINAWFSVVESTLKLTRHPVTTRNSSR